MKATQINRVLTGLGYDTNNTMQISEIRALILATNQGINQHEEFITIDKENNLIEIKKYNYKVISARISNNITIDGRKLYSNGSNIYIRHSLYSFRVPRLGDNVFVVSKDGTVKSNICKIVQINPSIIELDKALDNIDLKNDFIVYADSNLFSRAVQDQNVPALYFVYTPITTNKQDIYLEGEGLVGIELYSAMLGSL